MMYTQLQQTIIRIQEKHQANNGTILYWADLAMAKLGYEAFPLLVVAAVAMGWNSKDCIREAIQKIDEDISDNIHKIGNTKVYQEQKESFEKQIRLYNQQRATRAFPIANAEQLYYGWHEAAAKKLIDRRHTYMTLLNTYTS